VPWSKSQVRCELLERILQNVVTPAKISYLDVPRGEKSMLLLKTTIKPPAKHKC
jgi:hypothetical protein